MLSTDSPSDPSCSDSKASSAAVKTNEKSTDLVEAIGHGEHSHLPNFSLRDYVFKSRSRDIGINWPFPEQLLKLCVNNGVRDLLPPFEPPSLVRAHCLNREAESDQLPKSSENKTAIFEHGEREVDSLLESSLPVDSLVVANSDKFPVERREYCEVHQERNQELVSNSVTVSDPMASKVCPVCKAFTSTSNTTLNAHIDQCLSCGPCDMIMDVSELAKPRVKLGKKRLMVDIYTTARHCTLEDLDRRNGTNWATNLSLLAPSNHVGVSANAIELETKRTKFSASSAGGKVGDIYVDSNGMKILILSEINDSPMSVKSKKFKLKKHGKGFKEEKSCLIAKKKSLKPSCSRFVNDTPQTTKLCTLKGLGEIEGVAEGDDMPEAHEENEESISPPPYARYQVNNEKPATLGHWVCSKRSDVSRKHCSKSINQGSENSTSRKLLSESSSRALNFASSSEAAISPETKGFNILSNSGKDIDNLKKSFTQPSMLNSNDIHMGDKASTRESHNLLSKARKGLTSFSRTCFALDGREVDKRENIVTPKKFRKHRSMSGCNMSREQEKYSVSETYDDYRDKGSSGMVDSTGSAVTVAHIPDTNMDLIPEEQCGPISRDEIHVASLAQRSTNNQEVQCLDVISNKVITAGAQISGVQAEQTLQNGEFQTDSSSLSGHTLMRLDTAQENSTANSITVKSNHEADTIVCTELCGSPVSTTTTITHPSPVDDKFNYSEAEQGTELAPLQEKLNSMPVRKEDIVKLSPSVREPSCTKNVAANLSIKPSNVSSFHPYCLKPHSESVLTVNCSKSIDPCSCSRAESAPSPILRLMGKDLVVNKEEPFQLPTTLPHDPEYSSRTNFISFGAPNRFSFANYNSHYNYQIHAAANQQIAAQQSLRPIVPSYHAREVIVIDDDSHESKPEPRASFAAFPQTVQSADRLTPQMPFACFPVQKPYASRAVNTSQRQNQEGSFIFPSSPSLYFSQTLR